MTADLVHLSPLDTLADDALGTVAEAIAARAPGRVSTVTTFWLGGARRVEVEYCPQDHRSGYGSLTAIETGGPKPCTHVQGFRWQDEDEAEAVARIGVAIADWLIAEP